jgi:hypothetical protein
VFHKRVANPREPRRRTHTAKWNEWALESRCASAKHIASAKQCCGMLSRVELALMNTRSSLDLPSIVVVSSALAIILGAMLDLG